MNELDQKNKGKIVLAYSGGLDTSVITAWLNDQGFEVICFLADIGQPLDDLKVIEEKALKSGAKKFIAENFQQEFVDDFMFHCMWWNAVYEGEYLLGSSMARPLIAKRQTEIAKQEGANYVSHGCTGKGNDQVRFEFTYYAFEPTIKILAPWKEEEFRKVFPGRQEMIEFANKKNIPIKATKDKPWSSDENLMITTYEAGMLEDPWQKPREDMFEMTTDPKKAPDKETELEIEWENGIPVAINGEKMNSVSLVKYLNKVGGENGIGRMDMVENRYVGMKSRGVYETPGGAILWKAHRAMESLTTDRDLMHLKEMLMPIYAELVYYGYWYSRKMEGLMSFVKETQKNVTGIVRLSLYKGNITITGRKSPFSLYDANIASMDADQGAYDQSKARGFIDILALPIRVQAMKKKKQ